MAVITYCLVLTSGNIQLPSPLGSTAWLKLGLLLKLGQIFLPEDPFSSGACKYHSVIVMFSLLQPSPQGFHPLPGYSVKETAGTGITPDSELSLKNRWGGGRGGREVGGKGMPFISLLLLVSIQETLRSVDLIFLLATGHLRKLMKATDTLSNSH